MFKRVSHNIHRVAVVALLTVALVATAFAHRLSNPSDPVFEAYVIAGGDISDLCGGSGSGGQTTHSDCQACHIIGSVLLPDHLPSRVEADYIFVATVIAPQERRAIRAVLDPARGVRAPPLA
ncbi:hypothetical protein [Celeribacter sp.]|uniref:hypothetical protein n=1 Tax=Celeribacter sp. TaxID=1890673 RepID=UPI003A904340